MGRRARICRWLLALIFGVVATSWAIRAAIGPGRRDSEPSPQAATSTPQADDSSYPQMEPVQLHLIPRAQPTPLTPVYQLKDRPGDP